MVARGRQDWPARHERPAIDEAALVAARHADALLAEARALGIERWAAYLAPLPDALRDASLKDLRAVALKARAAFGPKDSIRDALPADLTEPWLGAVDRLIKAIARAEMEG